MMLSWSRGNLSLYHANHRAYRLSFISSYLRGKSLVRLICLLMLADFVFFVGIAIWSRTLAYQSQIEEGVVATRNMSAATIHHAESTLDIAGWMLEGLVERIEADGTGRVALRKSMQARVAERGAPLDRLVVFDRSGRVVATTMASDDAGREDIWRASVAYHLTHPDRGLHIGAPAGRQFMTVSRRFDDEEGRYAGAVVATIPLRYFQDFYRRLAPKPRALVTLTLADGTPLAGLPGTPAPVAHPAPFRLKTKGMEVAMLHSGARSDKYPLVADAALAREDVLENWRRVTWKEATAQAGEMLAIYFVCYWVLGQMRARERLERELRDARDVLERQNAVLARLADTDGLTGLHNRRHLDQRMAAEVARAAREGTPVSLIMMDVDFFKRYNDAYGHAAGDDCLRMVSGVLASTVNRPADLAARFGGEEFAVLLPNTSENGARGIAEAICEGVRAAGLAHRASDFGIVTISAGVASIVPAPGFDVRTLVEAADAALYDAKASGRNRAR